MTAVIPPETVLALTNALDAAAWSAIYTAQDGEQVEDDDHG